MASCEQCEDFDTCPLGDDCPVAFEVEGMDLKCPWCGTDMAERGATLVTYDDYIGEHVVTECGPWQSEQGYIKPGEVARVVEELL
jgi:hypothetical protein